MYRQDMALNKLQQLVCHKTQPTNQPYLFKLSSNASTLCYKGLTSSFNDYDDNKRIQLKQKSENC